MQTLQIEKTNAIRAFSQADAAGKKLLTDLFGEKVLAAKAIDRIKTLEDALADQGLDSSEAYPFPNPSNAHQEAVNATAQLFIICKSLNEDWEADFNDDSQRKYTPWFIADKSGSGFALAYDGCGLWATNTDCGARLCYKDAATAMYAGKQFIAIYNKFLI